MGDGTGQGQDRTQRRRDGRRELAQRKRRQRRHVLAGLGLAAVLALAVLLIPRGSGRDEGDAVLAKAPRPSALERSIAGRDEQQQALEKVLGYTRFIHEGRPRKREVALTFDDGPGPYTDEILHILRRHDAPATFFVLGNMVGSRPDLIRKEMRQGHAVGGHTFDHPHMGQLALSTQIAEFNQLADAMEENGLAEPRMFRPPYGSFNADTIELLDHRRLLMVLWSIDTGDYLDPGSEVIAERALGGVKPGSVILLHDAGGDRSETVEALPRILHGLRKRHLQPVTIPQLLVDDPPPRDQSLEELSGIATETDAPPTPTPAPAASSG
jgi:peptidoglycan-N-acetylglucosamine deacetylase